MVPGWTLEYIYEGVRQGYGRARSKRRGAGEERVWRGLKIARGRAEYAETVRYALAIRYLYPYK